MINTIDLIKMVQKNFLLIVLLAICADARRLKTNDDAPIVITRQGVIRGSRENLSGLKVEKFLGIPYASVPRRFVYSQVNNNGWQGVLNATQYGPICPQLPFNNRTINLPQDENCLTMNVWRPVKSSTKEKLLPVFFWVHGSAYQFWSGSENSGDFLAPYGNMIVVTFNYRLGALGFAYGDGNEIQGNQGFSDVINALKWVQKNIVFFGGDPSRVTLAGFSAGSMMASIIPVLSEVDDHLYSRVWLLSGVQVGPFLIESTSTGLAKTKLLASKVGCGNVTSGPLTNEIISCLRKVNATTLITAEADIAIRQIGGSNVVPFLPVYGTPLIQKPLTQLFKDHPRVRKTTILNIIEQDEQGFLYGDPKPANKSEAFEMAFAQLSFVKKDLTKEQMQPFFDYYFPGTDPESLQRGLANFITAYTWECPSIILSEQYSTYHSVRFGIFKYNLDRYGKEARPNGPHHNDELELIFGQPFYRNPYSSTLVTENFVYSMRDKSASLRFMKSLADYVHGKKPDDWPRLRFNSSKPEKEPTIRIFDDNDTNVKYSNQRICLEWSKLLDFDIL